MLQNNSDKRSFLFFFAGIFGLAIFTYFLISNSSITGNLILGGISQSESIQQVYSEELGLYANESTQYNWTPENNCGYVNCSLKAVNVSLLVSANLSGNISIALLTSNGTFLLFSSEINSGTTSPVEVPPAKVLSDLNTSNTLLNDSLNEETNISAILNNSNLSVQIEPVANESLVTELTVNESIQVPTSDQINSSSEPASVVQAQSETITAEPTVAATAAVSSSESEATETSVDLGAGALTGAFVAVASIDASAENDSTNKSTNESTGNSTGDIGINISTVVSSALYKEFFFKNSCFETCELTPGINDTNYTILINLSPGISVNVTSISYEWDKSQSNPSKAKNLKPKLNLSEFSKVVKWKYSKANRASIRDNEGQFDGGVDYELIAGADEVTFTNNSLAIALNVTIRPENSYGVLVSKYNYSIGKRVEVGVNPEGTIRFTLSDSNAVVHIETIEAYNDNAPHEVIALLSDSAALLYVDDLLKAEGNASVLGDMNFSAGVSIGADSGQMPWTGQTFGNFRGFIKEVELYGN